MNSTSGLIGSELKVPVPKAGAIFSFFLTLLSRVRNGSTFGKVL